MRLNSFTDLSLRILLFAAAKQGEQFTIDDMNNFYQVSRGHLMKATSMLTREGYLQAIRGRSGGLRMTMNPRDINLGEVTRKTESDFHLVECMRENSACALQDFCKLPAPLQEATDAFLHVLDRYTLADIMLDRMRFVKSFKNKV